MYSLEIKRSADKAFSKLDKSILEIINRKINQILEDPSRFKPLRKPLQNKRRVHIGKSFVLVYSVDERAKAVIIWDYDHHDKVYKH